QMIEQKRHGMAHSANPAVQLAR
ncbi:MAG: hypothetical protein FD160_4015, partial [Caulobacteraceae bacterium]